MNQKQKTVCRTGHTAENKPPGIFRVPYSVFCILYSVFLDSSFLP